MNNHDGNGDVGLINKPHTPFEISCEVAMKNGVDTGKGNSFSEKTLKLSTPSMVANKVGYFEYECDIDDKNQLFLEEEKDNQCKEVINDVLIFTDEEGTVDCNSIVNRNINRSPGNSRRRNLQGGVLEANSNDPKLTPNENQHYSQQTTMNNSVTSIDWGADGSLPSKSERDRRNEIYNASLIFDDEISLSLDQAFVDDANIDRGNSIQNSALLREMSYQLSGACTTVEGILAQINHSTSTNSSQTSSTSKIESDCSLSCSTQNEERTQHSPCTRFGIWGREKELDILQSMYFSTTAATNFENETDYDFPVDLPPRHVWITGVPGIGKTSLVEAFLRHGSQFRVQPLVCRGIFEENWINSSKPYPGIISCFTDLFDFFLDRDDSEEWAERIQVWLDDESDVTLLVTLIPSLATLLDVDSENTKFSFDKMKDKYLFRRLSHAMGRILVLMCKFSSVVFFLDDVHWAGDDSLQLLKAILLSNGLKNFFFIGSHRSSIKVSHSLHKIKIELSALFGADIKLDGIGKKSAKSLVRSHLHRLHNESTIDDGVLESILKSWHAQSRTKIPIFLEHLVHLLYEQKDFKVKDGKWILGSATPLPSSTLNVVKERIEGFPLEYGLVLKGAALLDINDFNTDMLMVAVSAIPKSRMPEMDRFKIENILRILSDKMLIEEHSAGRYSFAHNIVKVAVSTRIPDGTKRRSRIHWRLATDLKRLKDNTQPEKPATEKSFTSLLIACHMNKGISSIEDRDKIHMVVKLYLQLAEASMKRSAFMTAVNILNTAVDTLDKKLKWNESYDLTLKTYLALARCLYCTDEFDKAKSFLNAIVANGDPPRDTIDAFDLLISIYRSKRQYEQSKQCALKALNDIWDDDIINLNVEEKFSKIRELVQNKSDADLLVLPDMEHKKSSKKMPFLLQLAEISGLCRDYKLQDLAALRMVELTLKYGSFENNFTGLAFALCGLSFSRRHLHGEAYRYGRLAEMMSEQDHPLGRKAIVHNNYSLRHWRNRMRESRKSLVEICKVSMKSSEIENLSFEVGVYLSVIIYTGSPFGFEDDFLSLYNKKSNRTEFPEFWNVVAPYNLIMELKGERSKQIKMKFSEKKAAQYQLFFQMVTFIFLNDVEKAEQLNSEIFVKPGGCWGSYRVFMEGLISTYNAQSTSGKTKLLHQKKSSKFIEILTTWTKRGMNNSAHMANILKVELLIASDKVVASKRLSILLDTAISSAYQDGFPHHAALASERAGMHFLRNKDEKLASKYLSRASLLYKEWGAKAKVNQLESGYGSYLNATLIPLRCPKKSSSIPSSGLMFTDKKAELSRDDKRSTRRSRSHDDHRPSSDKRKKIALKKGTKEAQSSHSRGRPVLSKAAKEISKPYQSRSQSLHQRRPRQRRPSLVRIGSWASIKSSVSNSTIDKPTVPSNHGGSKKKSPDNQNETTPKEEKEKASADGKGLKSPKLAIRKKKKESTTTTTTTETNEAPNAFMAKPKRKNSRLRSKTLTL